MLAGLKLFERKKSYCEKILGAVVRVCSLKIVFWKFCKNYKKKTAPESFFNKKDLQAHNEFFTGDFFSNFLELSMVFGPVKKSSGNIYISLKTKSKQKSLNYLKIKIISKNWI